MALVGILGHYGGGREFFDGQTVKTKIVTAELEAAFGRENVLCLDTYNWRRHPFGLIAGCIRLIKSSDNVIMLPAHNGLKVFSSLLSLINRLYKKSLHYVVIGGWLPEYLDSHRLTARCLKRFSGVYPETEQMKKALGARGFNNVSVVPNCKNIRILAENELPAAAARPYPLCTFSRVMREKGTGEAVEAVLSINAEHGPTFTLDIYGQIEPSQSEWFEALQAKTGDSVRYMGTVGFDKSTDVLKNYTALLFPTYYDGEGFAGTLIDAMAAGVPVIASDWRYNSEIVVPNKTGIICKAPEDEAHINAGVLKESLLCLAEAPEAWNAMRPLCLRQAKRYVPSEALKPLFDALILKSMESTAKKLRKG